MNKAFVVCNQLGQYWGKKKKWADGTDPRRVQTCKHEDEAVNLLVELSSRDIDLRGAVTPVAISERGVPEIEPSEHLISEEPEIPIAPENVTGAQEAEAELEPGPALEPTSEAETEQPLS